MKIFGIEIRKAKKNLHKFTDRDREISANIRKEKAEIRRLEAKKKQLALREEISELKEDIAEMRGYSDNDLDTEPEQPFDLNNPLIQLIAGRLIGANSGEVTTPNPNQSPQTQGLGLPVNPELMGLLQNLDIRKIRPFLERFQKETTKDTSEEKNPPK